MEYGKVDILLVDDRPDGLIALEAILANPLYNLVKANSGSEALSKLASHDFAVILLDVQMPIMNGFECAAAIKERELHQHIPIVFVTAINHDDKYVFRGYETGAVDYIFKPFNPLILKSKVAVFVDLFRQSRRIRHQEARLVEVERQERIRQLAELEVEARRRYHNLADSIPQVVCRSRADGQLEYFNRAWVEYTGLSVEASTGEGWQRAIHPEDLGIFLKTWVDAMIEGCEWEVDARLRSREGEYRWYAHRGVPERRSPEGPVVGWIGGSIDIHERRQSQEEMRLAKEAADAANNAKTQFIANVSHEIRTPLSAIIGFSELMLTTEQSLEDHLGCAATIRRNGEQLLTLINEILDISKVEAGKLEVESLDVDIETVLADLRPVFQLKASEKALNFSIECETRLPRFAMTDPTRFRQILVNIIGNAIKFTEKGGVLVRLAMRASSLRVQVVDSGIGIPTEKLGKLFQPFSQVDSSTSRRFGGSGLGLALSKRLAQSLGGDIRVASTGEGGSVFEILLDFGSPCFDRGAIAEGLFAPGERAPRASTKKSTATVLAGLKLLLVDDAPDNQVLISRYLRFEGAEVTVASNGEQAVQKACKHGYDVILMDIQMPHMDGYCATKILREMGYRTPILALTAHALQSEREKCLNAGFDDHLAKPVDRTALIDRVRHFGQRKFSTDSPTIEQGGNKGSRDAGPAPRGDHQTSLV